MNMFWRRVAPATRKIILTSWNIAEGILIVYSMSERQWIAHARTMCDIHYRTWYQHLAKNGCKTMVYKKSSVAVSTIISSMGWQKYKVWLSRVCDAVAQKHGCMVSMFRYDMAMWSNKIYEIIMWKVSHEKKMEKLRYVKKSSVAVSTRKWDVRRRKYEVWFACERSPAGGKRQSCFEASLCIVSLFGYEMRMWEKMYEKH